MSGPRDLDLGELQRRVERAIRPAFGVTVVKDIQALHGGRSGLTYRVSLLGKGQPPLDVVVRLAPPGLAPVKNRDVLRQAHILRELRKGGFSPVPAVLFEDAGEPPDSPPLFAMEFIPGEAVEPAHDHHAALPPAATLAARTIHAVWTLADLHAVHPDELALDSEVLGSLLDEVDRWERVLDSVDPVLGGEYKVCAGRLRGTLPAITPAVVVHGDYRLGNLLCEGSDVRAVLDWEIWTLGDRRQDLAYFLAVTCPDDHSYDARIVEGIPSRHALIAEYERRSGAAIADLRWFDALTRFKQVAIMGQLVKHSRGSPDSDPLLQASARDASFVIERALELLA